MVEWEKFKPFGPNPDDQLVTIVSITRRGLIILPAKLMTGLFPKAKFAQILFSAEEGTVAIRFFTKKSMGLFSITPTRWNSRIFAKSALKFFKLDYSKTRSYLAQVVEEEGAVLFDSRNCLREK